MKNRSGVCAVRQVLSFKPSLGHLKPKIIALFCFLQFIANASYAEMYGNYDVKKILIVTETESGQKKGVDLRYLDSIINDLGKHASVYPPRFDNAADLQRAKADARSLSGVLDILVDTPTASTDLLKRSSLINSIGFMLDIPGSADKADRDFRNLLNQMPDDTFANYRYGVFLADSNQGSKALPYLEKSAKAGVKQAYYSLGMAYLSQQNTELAVKNLEIYKGLMPNNGQIEGLLDAIKSGNVKFKKH